MKEISAEEVAQLVADKVAPAIIDVRETEELESGRIPGVIHIPLGLLEFRLQDLDKKTPYIVVCRSGGRSGRAVQLLEERGYTATNMIGGMLEWTGPVE
ncbi:rhodanese-like domain-containing protein [Sporosarcina sp. NCCP-2716]|uniref:rhodanese-like domain-containing protein n=1 Tax=Sporosarcina sp. NCCP-2716 TaxID=2943679 RepID=UPI00203EEDEE|nr:rhodanese-like domain-containing protein [Sporosarcina sp. NCCP-2716]GKV69273.1 rhodanese-like domain-containing protein [Sporosarcina sp. NCCP-2716]